MRVKILFIINPTSGSAATKVDVPALLHQFLDQEKFECQIRVTEYAGHATELARDAAFKGIPVVCAVGGDGTVNEVARGLVYSNTALAILPRGSGNGLARHLEIPMHIPQAIAIINQYYISQIDSCSINEHPFFCTAGIGFDAHVSSVFAASTKRGLQTYVRLVFQEFLKFKPKPVYLHINGQKLETLCFVVAFANASQYGNNAYIAPMADIRDGFLDVCLIQELNYRQALALSYGLITKSIATSSDVTYFKTNEVLVESPDVFKYHADGEYIGEANTFKIKVMPLALKVLIPQI
ncbi:diacylglycerol/lipid kinase family protein [Adhaeribacter aquaticus]|uniref:diacylglycerol/lipid kinase family protein n=1 Tax=Adhaeribacter aquaticus TaxID=299567 RepID=UPI0003F4C4DF|nr:diacylglycerol kinase family protein [Adhaeribacter aquaticus]